MGRITQQHIHLLDNKVKCTACKRQLFEGVIELGAINIVCPKCGNENLIVSLQPEKKSLSDDSPISRLRNIFYRN